ncbi:hypothetical protein PB01_11375 [Psychrobacillus glaciei]|uniref:Uncharacterized protein n=1 Tax=Psychrobacillus glaciei TaxID=2283160 RepID=A0A5J6SRC1_9BACI|nr:hypothetical protein [Psychrobacillus glaciei]QFF99374.1 hypothetical protein PB01_11375 [Psychrobacillus glaciei]
MKKIFWGLVVSVGILFSYYYQMPIMTANEVTIKAIEILQKPPEEWKFPYVELKDIPLENIQVQLTPQAGFLNKLVNKQQCELTIKYQDLEPTLALDAYTGKLIAIYGPVS